MTTISREVWLQGQRLAYGASWVQANVYLCFVDGQKKVIKDYAAAPWLFRHTVCRWILSREMKALKRLSHTGVAARFDMRCDTFAYAMEYIEGEPFKYQRHIRTPEDVVALQTAVDSMHAAGVVHNDLHGGNIIVTADGRFILIDFASAFCKNQNGGLLAAINNMFFVFFEMLDNSKITRIKEKFDPQLLSTNDQRCLNVKRMISWITKAWKRLINEPLLRKRTWQKRKERFDRWLRR